MKQLGPREAILAAARRGSVGLMLVALLSAWSIGVTESPPSPATA